MTKSIRSYLVLTAALIVSSVFIGCNGCASLQLNPAEPTYTAAQVAAMMNTRKESAPHKRLHQVDQSATTEPTPQPTVAPSQPPAAWLEAVHRMIEASKDADDVASPTPPAPQSITFPASIRMESALTDKPDCPPVTDEERAKHTSKPCPKSLAERNAASEEGTMKATQTMAKASIVTAGATVLTGLSTAASAAEGAICLARGCSSATAISSSSSAASAVAANKVGLPAGTVMQGSNGTTFRVAGQ